MIGLLSLVLLVSASIGFAPPEGRDDAVVDLAKLSLSELDKRISDAHLLLYVSEQRNRKNHLEALLLQIVKHGGPEAEAIHSRRLRERPELLKAAETELERLNSEQRRDAWAKQYRIVHGLQQNIEFLTALRRVQKKNDPLEIDVLLAADLKEWPPDLQQAIDLVDAVEAGSSLLSDQVRAERNKASLGLEEAKRRLNEIDADNAAAAWKQQNAVVQRLRDAKKELGWRIEWLLNAEKLVPHATKVNSRDAVNAQPDNLPTIIVALKSADVERAPLWLKVAGDYRSGRGARWRFEVKDSQGAILPAAPSPSGIGGGMYSHKLVECGDTLETTMLPMSRYVEITKPGDYTVTVLYHNNVTIADVDDPDDLESLILLRSKPFKLTIEKRKSKR